MKHKGYALTLFLALALCLTLAGPPACGEDTPLQDIERAAREYAPGVDLTATTGWNDGLSSILATGTEELSGIVKPALRSGVLLLVVVMLCGAAKGAADQGSRVFQGASIGGVLAVAAISMVDVDSMVGLGREAIQAMSGLSDVLLPAMAAAATAAGSPAAGVAKQLATVLFSTLLIRLITQVLIPLTYAFVAASCVYAAIGNPGLKRLASAIKGIVTGILTTVLISFVGYLTVSGVIAGATDATTVKTAKLAMSSMVPVVGGVLSDAAETVLAGAGMLKNAIGLLGTLVILAICLTPFLQMGIHYLVYKLSAALAATVGDGSVVDLIDEIGQAFGLVLGMTASCALLLLVSVISGLNAVGVM